MAQDNEEGTPLGSIGFGILMIAIGVGCYFWFDHMETEGGRVRTHVLIILIYKLLGKWGVLGLFGGIGLLLTAIGVKGLIAGKPAPEEQDPGTEQGEV